MQIYRNPETILPCPLEGAENILPARAGQEGFAIPHVDSPPRDRQSDPIQSSTCDFREILLGLNGEKGGEEKGRLSEHAERGVSGGLTYDESVVVVLQLTEPAVCRVCCHQGAECPLIDCASSCVWLEECRGNEGFQHKPSANIDTDEWTGVPRQCREHDEKRVMGTRGMALTRIACRPPTSTSYSTVASTNSAERCHCTGLPGPKPLGFNCKIVTSAIGEKKRGYNVQKPPNGFRYVNSVPFSIVTVEPSPPVIPWGGLVGGSWLSPPLSVPLLGP